MDSLVHVAFCAGFVASPTVLVDYEWLRSLLASKTQYVVVEQHRCFPARCGSDDQVYYDCFEEPDGVSEGGCSSAGDVASDLAAPVFCACQEERAAECPLNAIAPSRPMLCNAGDGDDRLEAGSCEPSRTAGPRWCFRSHERACEAWGSGAAEDAAAAAVVKVIRKVFRKCPVQSRQRFSWCVKPLLGEHGFEVGAPGTVDEVALVATAGWIREVFGDDTCCACEPRGAENAASAPFVWSPKALLSARGDTCFDGHSVESLDDEPRGEGGLPAFAGGTCETDLRNDDDAVSDPPSAAELRRELAQRAEGVPPGVFVPELHEDILCNTLSHFEHRICSEEELYVFRHYLERQFEKLGEDEPRRRARVFHGATGAAISLCVSFDAQHRSRKAGGAAFSSIVRRGAAE